MQRVLGVLFFLLLMVLSASASEQDTAMLKKARRAYENGEWASSYAMYGVVASRSGAPAETFSRRLLAAEFLGDTLSTRRLVEEAFAAGQGLPELMADLRAEAFDKNAPEAYEHILLRGRRSMPWLTRPIDTALLDFYTFRRQPAEMKRCARALLNGLPDSVELWRALAQACMLEDDYAGALDAYNHILTLSPDDADARVHVEVISGL